MASGDSGTIRPAKRMRVFFAAAVLLIVCVLAVGSVSAADTVTVYDYTQLSDNISNAQNDLTIIIAANISVGANQGFTVTKNITLTTTADEDHKIYRIAENTSNQNGMFTIQSGGNLTIQGNNSQMFTHTLTLDGNKTALPENGQTLVWVKEGGYFTLGNGGVLTNNNVTGQSASGTEQKNSGGVYVLGGTFTMNGGEISNNTVGNSGGGVYVLGGTFTMKDGKISNNTVINNGGGVCVNNGTFTMFGGTISDNKAHNGGGVFVCDLVEYVCGTFTMSGGTISGNTATDLGGGVYIDHFGMFVIAHTAQISENGAKNGGGVYVLPDGTFSLFGGEISGNKADGTGGGNDTGNGGGVYVMKGGDVTMSGGTISGNTAKGTGSGSNTGNGGGVYVDDQGSTFTMSGGTISENRADGNGDGVYVGGTFNVDTTGTADSVYLPQGRVITVIQQQFTGKISGIVSENRNIGTRIVSFNSPVQGSSEDREYFQLDETLTELSLGLTYDADEDILKLAQTYTVSFQAYDGTPVPEDQTVTHGDPVDEPKTLTKDGNKFDGWHADEECTQPWNFNDGITSDRTLYAKWTPNEPGPTPVPPSGGGSSDGNMDNAYRVLFNDGATTLYIVTDLSAGDKLTKPEDPVKDGYTFAGWHKDTACTQPWDFNDGITGDMTLYAKWTPQETVTPTATATPTVTATATATATPTGNASPAPTVQPDNNGNNGDTTNGETTATPGISLPYLIGGILILLLAILLLLILLLRHTVTFLIPTGGELEEYRIKVWHGRYINTEDLPDLIRTAAWYRDTERQERWDFDQDRVKKSIELYLG